MTRADSLREGAGSVPIAPGRLRGLWKAAGVLCAVSGAQMLVVWPILIASGQVPELHTETVYMLFHLSSRLLKKSGSGRAFA